MKGDKFHKAYALKTKIIKAEQAIGFLKSESGCFMILEKYGHQYIYEGDDLRHNLIEFFQKQIEELTTQFNKL